jgi:hypothetical protein
LLPLGALVHFRCNHEHVEWCGERCSLLVFGAVFAAVLGCKVAVLWCMP